MKYHATVEMAKGEGRRIHLNFSGTEFVDLGPIKDQIPVNDGVMPVAYGYLNDFINPTEKDNVDVLIFSAGDYKTAQKTEVEIFGMLTREDGDHKLLAKDESMTVNNFEGVEEKERELILNYFGYKSPVIAIDNKEKAEAYLQACLSGKVY